ncbi:heme NO-binding domain-containing protein [Kiloniella spongiae]|uniref:heme NO-binding domain-containing protein n=1 Tax=Kiloniella spongiae TaxID=1489064 RepID=UPI000699BF3A|nr:heme NO-binding domain-containing protein [Kiloniella spongiae]
MYGMVNKYIVQTIQNAYGEKKWMEITAQIPEIPHFSQMKQYPDDITYLIVQKSVEILAVDADTLLEILGKGWIKETANGPYGNYYKLYGDTVFSFLNNLDTMHAALGAQMTDLSPPSFICKNIDSNTICIRYMSDRPGLTSFVKGLLEGLCEKFNYPGHVTIKQVRSDDIDYDEFFIEKTA